mgnify:CR=1 FL=1
MMDSAFTNAIAATTAQFRDYGPTASIALGSFVPNREPLGPANRRTGLVFSEVMYNEMVQFPGGAIERAEVRIFGADDSPRNTPLAVAPIDEKGFAHWTPGMVPSAAGAPTKSSSLATPKSQGPR